MGSPRLMICPFCGHTQRPGERCQDCGTAFAPAARKATVDAMGPWFVRDAERPFLPGLSYETLLRLIGRGEVRRYSILRGPTTRQLWTVARHVPGVAHHLGYCHACDAPVSPTDPGCHHCGATFGVVADRDRLGLLDERDVATPSESRSAGFVPMTEEATNAAAERTAPRQPTSRPSARHEATGNGRAAAHDDGRLSAFATDEELFGPGGRAGRAMAPHRGEAAVASVATAAPGVPAAPAASNAGSIVVPAPALAPTERSPRESIGSASPSPLHHAAAPEGVPRGSQAGGAFARGAEGIDGLERLARETLERSLRSTVNRQQRAIRVLGALTIVVVIALIILIGLVAAGSPSLLRFAGPRSDAAPRGATSSAPAAPSPRPGSGGAADVERHGEAPGTTGSPGAAGIAAPSTESTARLAEDVEALARETSGTPDERRLRAEAIAVRLDRAATAPGADAKAIATMRERLRAVAAQIELDAVLPH